MGRQKILIVEDDADISALLVKIMEVGRISGAAGIFRNRGIILYGTGITGLCAVGSDASGDDRRRGVGADPTGTEKEMPVLILSAKVSVQDKVKLLRLGADDYITKPFDPEEVIARVEAAMRRYTKEAQNMEAEQEVFDTKI